MTNLAYTFSITRIAHFVKRMMREYIRSTADGEYVQRVLSGVAGRLRHEHHESGRSHAPLLPVQGRQRRGRAEAGSRSVGTRPSSRCCRTCSSKEWTSSCVSKAALGGPLRTGRDIETLDTRKDERCLNFARWLSVCQGYNFKKDEAVDRRLHHEADRRHQGPHRRSGVQESDEPHRRSEGGRGAERRAVGDRRDRRRLPLGSSVHRQPTRVAQLAYLDLGDITVAIQFAVYEFDPIAKKYFSALPATTPT